MSRLAHASILIVLTLVGAPLSAQSPATSNPVLHRSLTDLKPGTVIRATNDLARVQGTLRSLSPDAVVLDVDHGKYALRLGEVDSLWVWRTRPAKGALIGGLVGLGVGLIAGAVAAPSGYDTPPTVYAALYGAGGLLSGAFLGLVGGSAIPYWDRKYPDMDR